MESKVTFSGVLKQHGFKPIGQVRTDVTGYERNNENHLGCYAEIVNYGFFKQVWITGSPIPSKSYPSGMLVNTPTELKYILDKYLTNEQLERTK